MALFKTCTKCKKAKLITEFHRDSKRKDGRRSQCKECQCIKRREYTRLNPDKAKAYREANKERQDTYAKTYQEKNRGEIAERSRRWHQENKERHSAQNRAWQEDHREEERLRLKRSYQENRDQIVSRQREYRRNNKEKERDRQRKWRTVNPEKARAQYSRRHAVVRNSPGSFTPEDIQRIFSLQSGKCVYHSLNPRCHVNLANGYTVDHIVPLSRGGTNFVSNIQLLCEHCNKSKCNKTHDEYLDYLARSY